MIQKKEMYRGRTASRCTGLAFLLLILGSCTSLPLPDSASEGLLIIPADISLYTHNKRRKVVRVMMEFSSADSAETENEELVIEQNRLYGSVSLREGSYVIRHFTVYTSEPMDPLHPAEMLFTAEQPITVLPRSVKLADFGFYLVPAENTPGYECGFRPLSQEFAVMDILKQISERKEWIAWKRYDKVNFPASFSEESPDEGVSSDDDSVAEETRREARLRKRAERKAEREAAKKAAEAEKEDQ